MSCTHTVRLRRSYCKSRRWLSAWYSWVEKWWISDIVKRYVARRMKLLHREWLVRLLCGRGSIRKAFFMVVEKSRLDHSPSIVSALEVLEVCRVYRPVVTFATLAPAGFCKALVQRQVVTDAISPTGFCSAEIRMSLRDTVVNILQAKATGRTLQDGASYQLYVRGIRSHRRLFLCSCSFLLRRWRAEGNGRVMSSTVEGFAFRNAPLFSWHTSAKLTAFVQKNICSSL